VKLGVGAASAVLFDPVHGTCGLGAVREEKDGRTGLYLQLEPGQSRIVRTTDDPVSAGPRWEYVFEGDTEYELNGTWDVDFIEGGPVLPGGFSTEQLASWTEQGGAETRAFGGTAVYKLSFQKPDSEAERWMLDLGRVCESARLRLNGKYLGALWCFPFRTVIDGPLEEGENLLEVEVSNLPANRIADLERRGVEWKKFYDINFVNIRYEAFDASEWEPLESGLLGPVRLIPLGKGREPPP